MEILARDKAEKLLDKDSSNRRKLRQMQVRQQSNEWMERNRKRYLEERQQQIKLITESLTQDAQEKVVRDIEILERMHDLCVAEVGAAHRAAANLPDFELLQSQRNQENCERARNRGAQALAQEKIAADKAAREIKRAKIIRENIRREEDNRLKEFVQRPRPTKSQDAVDRIMDKLTNNKRTEKKRHPEYQPSLAKALRVPKESGSETKISKSKKHARLSRKPKDVVYYDYSIPRGSLKYPPPPGLVEKHSKQPAGTAFEIAKQITREQHKKEKAEKIQDLEKAKEAERRGKTALKVAKLQRQLDDLKNEFLKSGFHADPKLNDSFLGLSNSGSEEGQQVEEEDVTDAFPTRDGDVMTARDDEKLKASKQSSGGPELPDTDRRTKIPESPKRGVPSLTKSPKKDVIQAGKVVPRPPTKDVPRPAVVEPSPKMHTTKAPTDKQGPPGTTEISTDRVEDGVQDFDRRYSGRVSPLEKSIVLPPDTREIPVHEEAEAEKPKLISTKKSIRNQQKILDSMATTPASLVSGAARATAGNGPKYVLTDVSSVGSKIKDSLSTKAVKKLKETPKPKPESPGDWLLEAEDQGGSSDSLHTLPTIDSLTSVQNNQITDHRSPPDLSNEFPFTSTPAEDAKKSTMTSMNNTSCSQGPVSPRTARKRKKALMYYVQKLLQMRPESLNNLAATSSGSISSCIEIPSSAVSSIISSGPTSGSASNSSSVGDTTKSTTGKYTNNKYFSTNGTTDHYTTLSSVTEEDEGEFTSELRSYEQDSEQTSSGETLAKITVAVSPRSNSEST